ncbi:MAG: hypothetical protein HQL23_09650 [Candidatus Omnitrophica bacterium]|nr:hypothetical protein [Candidatus Omnitrophota bacterium]
MRKDRLFAALVTPQNQPKLFYEELGRYLKMIGLDDARIENILCEFGKGKKGAAQNRFGLWRRIALLAPLGRLFAILGSHYRVDELPLLTGYVEAAFPKHILIRNRGILVTHPARYPTIGTVYAHSFSFNVFPAGYEGGLIDRRFGQYLDGLFTTYPEARVAMLGHLHPEQPLLFRKLSNGRWEASLLAEQAGLNADEYAAIAVPSLLYDYDTTKVVYEQEGRDGQRIVGWEELTGIKPSVNVEEWAPQIGLALDEAVQNHAAWVYRFYQQTKTARRTSLGLVRQTEFSPDYAQAQRIWEFLLKRQYIRSLIQDRAEGSIERDFEDLRDGDTHDMYVVLEQARVRHMQMYYSKSFGQAALRVNHPETFNKFIDLGLGIRDDLIQQVKQDLPQGAAFTDFGKALAAAVEQVMAASPVSVRVQAAVVLVLMAVVGAGALKAFGSAGAGMLKVLPAVLKAVNLMAGLQTVFVPVLVGMGISGIVVLVSRPVLRAAFRARPVVRLALGIGIVALSAAVTGAVVSTLAGFFGGNVVAALTTMVMMANSWAAVKVATGNMQQFDSRRELSQDAVVAVARAEKNYIFTAYPANALKRAWRDLITEANRSAFEENQKRGEIAAVYQYARGEINKLLSRVNPAAAPGSSYLVCAESGRGGVYFRI